MEFAGGGSLYDFIRAHEGPLPEPLVWRLFIQVCFGGACALVPNWCRTDLMHCAAGTDRMQHVHRCCWGCARCTRAPCSTATSRRPTFSSTRPSTRRSATSAWQRRDACIFLVFMFFFFFSAFYDGVCILSLLPELRLHGRRLSSRGAAAAGRAGAQRALRVCAHRRRHAVLPVARAMRGQALQREERRARMFWCFLVL